MNEVAIGVEETIYGLEFGTWLSKDLRIGLGYSSRGFANPGAQSG